MIQITGKNAGKPALDTELLVDNKGVDL